MADNQLFFLLSLNKPPAANTSTKLPPTLTPDWQKPEIKERKQAEFLMESFFPWELVDRVGVRSENTFQEVNRILLGHTLSEAENRKKSVLLTPEGQK